MSPRTTTKTHPNKTAMRGITINHSQTALRGLNMNHSQTALRGRRLVNV